MEPKCIISVQIPDALDAFLLEEARRRMTSKSAVIREILADHLRQRGANPAGHQPHRGAEDMAA